MRQLLSAFILLLCLQPAWATIRDQPAPSPPIPEAFLGVWHDTVLQMDLIIDQNGPYHLEERGGGKENRYFYHLYDQEDNCIFLATRWTFNSKNPVSTERWCLTTKENNSILTQETRGGCNFPSKMLDHPDAEKLKHSQLDGGCDPNPGNDIIITETYYRSR